ncbi:hypothetical protein LEP1GSC060_1286 [Leptospira weilii serovar Ranarum str. ICFT]|uniref:Lipoprotein n=1 Tax=Leptospira weilii serovar Ranarum str. ICFT TaxID=1218598 RepID=N1WUQ7_9LEPT|nr:hypothetical protein [Leptospira weilii]EMY79608.1 hypothetical protein LEP1GSC060_1286 [Leptospira weilii serovar Ranarum str. ICFT]
MKRYEDSFIRGPLSFAVFFSILLFTISNCSSGKNDREKDLFLTLALLIAGQGNEIENSEFRFSNTNSLIAARSAASPQFRVGSSPTGFLTDLGGENPENYGDGNADGFTDHFLTPEAVSINVCKIVAYKTPEKGGPAVGSETFENASLVLYSGPKFENFTSDPARGPCETATVVALSGNNTNNSELPMDKFIPQSDRADYDRMGIVASNFTYFFAPTDVPENAYRFADLGLNPVLTVPLLSDRGHVETLILENGCPASHLNVPSYFFSELLAAGEEDMGCTLRGAYIDSNTGNFLDSPNSNDLFGVGGLNFKNPPLNAGEVYTSDKVLKFKLPKSAENLSPTEPYVMVVNLNPPEKDTSKKLVFNVSVDNVLFWDSNDPNNVFSPQTDAGDKPNAISGNDNLTDPSLKNVIFRLPTLISSFE